MPEIRHSGSLNWHPFILNGLVTFKPRVTGQPPSSNMTLLDPFGVVPIFFVSAVASFDPGVAWQVTVALTFSLRNQVALVKPPLLILAFTISFLVHSH